MKKLIAVLVGVLLLLPSLTMALEPFNNDLRYGMAKNAEVKRLQEYLRDEGLYKGEVTGNFYAVTRQSVRDLQKREGVKITGILDKTTREVLNSKGDEVAMSSDDNWLDEWIKNTPPLSPTLVNSPQPLMASQPHTSQPVNSNPTPVPIILPPDTGSTMMPTSTPVDTVAPKILYDVASKVYFEGSLNPSTRSMGSGAIMWGMKRPYGSEDMCQDCIVIRTDEPTTLYMEYLNGHHTVFDYFDPNQTYSDKVQTYNDSNLTDVHIIMLKHISAAQWPYVLNYRVKVTDASGNSTNNYTNAPYWPKYSTYDLAVEGAKDDAGRSDPVNWTLINNVRTIY